MLQRHQIMYGSIKNGFLWVHKIHSLTLNSDSVTPKTYETIYYKAYIPANIALYDEN